MELSTALRYRSDDYTRPPTGHESSRRPTVTRKPVSSSSINRRPVPARAGSANGQWAAQEQQNRDAQSYGWQYGGIDPGDRYDGPVARENPKPQEDQWRSLEYNGKDTRRDVLAWQMEGMDLEDGEGRPPLPTRPPISVNTSLPPKITDSPLYATPSRTDTGMSSMFSGPSRTNTDMTSTSSTSTKSTLSTTSSHMQKVYREARHFAGGLVSHPAESTKHFSVLRHSHGLVFYQGVETNIAISVFADAPLPADRSIWLQSKGWSGNTGMRTRALIGKNDTWIDVTPVTPATAEQMDPNDERAWQRDVKHFLKRADRRVRETHRLMETDIIRIPVEAQDGYFRFVLCTEGKKKILCPSPVFRILSTSTSPASLRGASLSTLPLELGAKLLATGAKSYAGAAVSPITSAVQSRVASYIPVNSSMATAAYNMTLADKVTSSLDDANSRYEQQLEMLFSPAPGQENILDEGPKPPYPIQFLGRVDTSNASQFDMPTAELTGLPETVMRRLLGYYFGWARVRPSKSSVPSSEQWYQAIISALPLNTAQLARLKVADVGKKNISICLIDDPEGNSFEDSKMEVRVMGFIRPQQESAATSPTMGEEVEYEIAMASAVNDVAITEAYLSHPAWGPEPLRERDDGERGGLYKVKSRYADTRVTAQKHLDKIAFHRAGVRVPTDRIRDKHIGTGGIYIIR
jgi:hypothetical protein